MAATEESRPGGARLVLFSSRDELYPGRTSRRERLLDMRPVDPTERAAGSRRPARPAGVYWEYLLADDSPLLVRARDLSDADEATWDADQVFKRASELRVLFVRDPRSGHLGWWMAREQDVVLVAPRAWPSTNRAAVVRHAARAVAALEAVPSWGEYPAS